MIVLNSNKYSVIELDKIIVGKKLKELRETKCKFRAELARYIGVSERILKSYENGEREIGIITFYKLMQFYQVSEISDFFNSLM